MFEDFVMNKNNPNVIKARSYGWFNIFKVFFAFIGLIITWPILFVAILIGTFCTFIKDTWYKGLKWSKKEISDIIIQKTMNKIFK